MVFFIVKVLSGIAMYLLGICQESDTKLVMFLSIKEKGTKLGEGGEPLTLRKRHSTK